MLQFSPVNVHSDASSSNDGNNGNNGNDASGFILMVVFVIIIFLIMCLCCCGHTAEQRPTLNDNGPRRTRIPIPPDGNVVQGPDLPLAQRIALGYPPPTAGVQRSSNSVRTLPLYESRSAGNHGSETSSSPPSYKSNNTI